MDLPSRGLEKVASMSESRRSDEDVIDFGVEVRAANQVASTSGSGLRRRSFADRLREASGEVVREGQQGGPSSAKPGFFAKASVGDGDDRVPRLEEDSEEEEAMMPGREAPTSESENEEGLSSYDEDGEEDSIEETTDGDGERESSEGSAGEGSELGSWTSFFVRCARTALPYAYMVFVSLALGYFLYLVNAQQREIHGLQSRIQSIEQACGRRRAESAHRPP